MNIMCKEWCNAGEWWNRDIQAVVNDFIQSGGGPMSSDAVLINGQPGDLFPCSRSGNKTNILDELFIFRIYHLINSLFFII